MRISSQAAGELTTMVIIVLVTRQLNTFRLCIFLPLYVLNGLSSQSVLPSILQSVRHLSVHEHISMTLLKDADVPTPKFGVATTAEEAKKIAAELDCPDLVVKAQVGVGGICQ